MEEVQLAKMKVNGNYLKMVGWYRMQIPAKASISMLSKWKKMNPKKDTL